MLSSLTLVIAMNTVRITTVTATILLSHLSSPAGVSAASLIVSPSLSVMAGLIPAIHDFLQRMKQDVDGRHKDGDDEFTAHSQPSGPAASWARSNFSTSRNSATNARAPWSSAASPFSAVASDASPTAPEALRSCVIQPKPAEKPARSCLYSRSSA